jgi:hypothetical protein
MGDGESKFVRGLALSFSLTHELMKFNLLTVCISADRTITLDQFTHFIWLWSADIKRREGAHKHPGSTMLSAYVSSVTSFVK